MSRLERRQTIPGHSSPPPSETSWVTTSSSPHSHSHPRAPTHHTDIVPGSYSLGIRSLYKEFSTTTGQSICTLFLLHPMQNGINHKGWGEEDRCTQRHKYKIV